MLNFSMRARASGSFSEFERLIGVAVAAEEVFEPQHVPLTNAAHDHRAAAAGLDQSDATQNEGAHDALAEVRFPDQQSAQPVGRDDERVHLVLGDGVDQGRASGQLRQLPHERAGTVRDDQLMIARRVALKNINVPLDDDRQPLRDLSHVGQRFARSIDAAAAEAAHALDLSRLEREEHLSTTRLDGRLRGICHWILAACAGGASLA